MKLLALDTAANLCSAALLDVESSTLLSEVSHDIGKGHAEQLMAVLDETLRGSGHSISDIAKIAVSVGPGSFTGVRVGVSTARGLALALKCPVVGVSTLEALAWDARQEAPGRAVLSIIDARRDELYSQFFSEAGEPLSEPAVNALPAIMEKLQVMGPVVLSGSGAVFVNAQLGQALEIASHRATGSAEAFARLGASRTAAGVPSPLYLRGLDVKPQQGFVLKRQEDAQ
jgi:tRNA threonylcarbamoyladenosine biosynthesis protein TsaB